MMKVLFLFLAIALLPALSAAASDEDGYYLKNTTKNLVSLDEQIIDVFGSLVFSEEEQKELDVIMNNIDIASTQEELLLSSQIPDRDVSLSEEDSYGIEKRMQSYTYNSYSASQNMVLMDNYFAGFDFVLRQYQKATMALEPFFY